MATLATPLRTGLRGGDWAASYNIYNFYTNADTPAWIHFKTNVGASDNCMCVIEAAGYHFAISASIHLVWSFYTWNGTLYDRGTIATAGLTTLGMYLSSDNYVCLRGTRNTMYYIGFVLHAFTAAAHSYGGVNPVVISAASQNSTSGNYY